MKMIGKAVALSEAIARSDRGPLPKLKEMVRNFKLEQVTDEISGALDKMNEEIVRSSAEDERTNAKLQKERAPWWHIREKKSPERRREYQRVKGTISFFSGIGLTITLYSLASAVILKLPPDVIAKIPFELEPLIHVLWTLGLIPVFAGLGHLTASLFIKSAPEKELRSQLPPPQEPLTPSPINTAPVAGRASVTDRTTDLLTSE
jgi:hypothetical protein